MGTSTPGTIVTPQCLLDRAASIGKGRARAAALPHIPAPFGVESDEMSTDDPVFQTVIAPFVVALLVVAASRLVGGGRRAELLAGVGVVLGILVGYALLEGVPQFPPPASKQKLFYLIAFGGLVGLVVDWLGRPSLIDALAIVAFPAVCLAWLASRQLNAGPELTLLVTLAVLWAGSAAALRRLADASDRGAGVTGPVLLIVAAIGTAGVALLGRTATLALLSGAIAAGAGAIALWNYVASIGGGGRASFGRTALLAAAGGLAVICALLVLYTPTASRVALVGILLVPFSETVARRLRLGSGAAERILSPIVHGAVAAVPALAAIGFAYWASGGTLTQ